MPADGSAQPNPIDVTEGASAMRQHGESEPPVTASRAPTTAFHPFRSWPLSTQQPLQC